MSWVCLNCSSSNEEESTRCAVCGYDRPTERELLERETDVIEGKIVFSEFAVIKESVKNFFKSVSKFAARIKAVVKDWSLRRERTRTEVSREPERREEPLREETPSRRAETPPRREETSPRREEIPPRREEDLPSVGSFASPWAEHKIIFDVDVMKSKGIIRSEQAEMNSVKGYMLYKEDGTSRFIRTEMLVALHMAKKI